MNTKTLCLAILTCCIMMAAFVQAQPVVTSVSPLTATPGATVTITGTSFNATPASNKVWFGATFAIPTAGSTTSLTVTVPAGATYGPVIVHNTTTGLSGQQKGSNFMPGCAGLADGALFYNAKVDFVVDGAAYAAEIADIDGDGKGDIVVTSATNEISVFRNTATSGVLNSGSFATKVDFATGSVPKGIAIGDIDGDGKADVVIANNSSTSVSVLRNTSTSGTVSFAAKTDFITGISPLDVAICDIDGDGRPDVLVTNFGSNSFSVFRNTSTSGAVSFAAKVDFASLGVIYGITTGDFDANGKTDVAITSGSTIVSIFGNTSTAGAISFAARIDMSIPSTVDAHDITTVDLDGDGKLDLVTVSYNAGGAGGIRGLRNTTSGTFSFDITYSKNGVYGGSEDIGIGDMNGDGKPDIAICSYGVSGAGTYIDIFRNSSVPGTVNLAEQASTAISSIFTVGSGPMSTALGDLDGDFLPDMVTANSGSNSISVLRRMLRPQVSSVSPLTAAPGAAVTITGVNFNSTPASNKVWFGATATIPTAGTAGSLTVTVPVGAIYAPVTVLNTVTGYSAEQTGNTFMPGHGNTAGIINFVSKVDFTAGNSPCGLAAGDIDGDGKADVVVANYGSNTISVFRNTSTSGVINNTSFASKVDFATGTQPWGIAIGDIDGDGKADVVVANSNSNNISIFRNTSTSGTISFAAMTVFSTTHANPRGVVIADLDRDNKLDIITADYNGNVSGGISIFRNTSASGVISLATGISYTPFAAGAVGIAAGDIDGDGRIDLVVTSESGSIGYVFRNANAVGMINAYDQSFFVTGTGPMGVVIGDIDGDSKPEVIVANSLATNVSVFRNTSTIGTVLLAAKMDFTTGTSPYFLGMGDIDGDSKADLVVSNISSNTVSVFRNTSTSGTINASSLAAKVDFTTGTVPLWPVVADLDGDSYPDIAVSNNSANTVSVLRSSMQLWKGITSVNWHTASNWSSLAVPTSTDLLIDILPTTPFSPLINASLTLNSNQILNIQPGATISVGASFVNNGTIGGLGTLAYTTSGLTMSGSGTYNSSAIEINLPNVADNITVSGSNSLGSSAQLKLTKGHLKTTSAGAFVILNNKEGGITSGTGNSAYDNSWIECNKSGAPDRGVRQYINSTGSYTLPVGNSTNSNRIVFSPAGLTGVSYVTASAGVSGTAATDTSGLLTITVPGGPVRKINSEGVWALTPDASPSAGNYSLQLYFNGFSGLTDNSFTVVRRTDASVLSSDWAFPASATLPAASSPGRTVTGGYARVNNISTFSNFGIGSSGNFPLSLSLVSFHATACADNSCAQLGWEVSDAGETVYFVVERSTDGKGFKDMGRVTASAGKKSYSYTDEGLSAGTYYYRLRMMDKDGSSSWSAASQVRLVRSLSPGIYPNPAAGVVHVLLPRECRGSVQVRILSGDGRRVWQKNEQIEDGQGAYEIDVNGLHPGMYVVDISWDGGSQSAGFMKQ